MPPIDSTWAWVPQVYPLGFRFAFVEGAGAGEMITACGVDPSTAQMRTLQEALDEYEDDPFFRTGEAAGWGFLVEELDGDSRDSLLSELSAGRRGVMVAWVSEKAMTVLDHYEDGHRIRSLQPDAPAEGTPVPETVLVSPTLSQVVLSPDALRDQADTSLVVATLDLLTTEFGIRLEREQVIGPLLTGEVDIDMSWLDEPRS